MNRKYNQDLRKKYNISPKRCKCCNTEIDFDKRNNDYCSHSCSARINNRGVIRVRKSAKCKSCGKEIWGWKRLSGFCNRQCKSQEYINKWLSGEVSGVISSNTGEQISSTIRKWFINKFGEKCQECGWNKINMYTNKIPLQFHHKNGNCRDNKLDNLSLLCPNCHSLTKTFGASNKGNGRKSRYL